MIKVVANNIIKEGCENAYLEEIKELVDKTRQEEGCISYTLNRPENTRNVLVMIEQWCDRAALENHFKQEHFIRIVDSTSKYCEETEGGIVIYEEVL